MHAKVITEANTQNVPLLELLVICLLPPPNNAPHPLLLFWDSEPFRGSVFALEDQLSVAGAMMLLMP